MELKKLVGNLLGELNKISKSDAVVGGVRDAGKVKVVPLSKISIGFATGLGGVDGKSGLVGGDGDAGGEAGGAGGAISVEPRAFVVVGEDGQPHMLALKNGKSAVLRKGIELSPTMLAEARKEFTGDAAGALPGGQSAGASDADDKTSGG